jgi:hypothetical protein
MDRQASSPLLVLKSSKALRRDVWNAASARRFARGREADTVYFGQCIPRMPVLARGA